MEEKLSKPHLVTQDHELTGMHATKIETISISKKRAQRSLVTHASSADEPNEINYS